MLSTASKYLNRIRDLRRVFGKTVGVKVSLEEKAVKQTDKTVVFEILVTMLQIAKRIPLLGQEGWLRIKKKLRSHL